MGTILYICKSPGDQLLANRLHPCKTTLQGEYKNLKTSPSTDIDSDHNVREAEEQTKLKALNKAKKRKPKWNLRKLI